MKYKGARGGEGSAASDEGTGELEAESLSVYSLSDDGEFSDDGSENGEDGSNDSGGDGGGVEEE